MSDNPLQDYRNVINELQTAVAMKQWDMVEGALFKLHTLHLEAENKIRGGAATTPEPEEEEHPTRSKKK